MLSGRATSPGFGGSMPFSSSPVGFVVTVPLFRYDRWFVPNWVPLSLFALAPHVSAAVLGGCVLAVLIALAVTDRLQHLPDIE